MKKRRININLYMVVWTDAAYNLDPDKENVKPPIACDFGFILKAGDEFLVLATEVFTEGHTRQAITIPMGMIKMIKKVVNVKMPKYFEADPSL